VAKKEWRKPEVRAIAAGSAEKAPTNNILDAVIQKS